MTRTFSTNSTQLKIPNVRWAGGGTGTMIVFPYEAIYDEDGLIWLLSPEDMRTGRVANLTLLPKQNLNAALDMIQQYVVPAIASVGIGLATAKTAGIVSILAKASGGNQAITKMVNNILNSAFRVPDADTWGYYNLNYDPKLDDFFDEGATFPFFSLFGPIYVP